MHSRYGYWILPLALIVAAMLFALIHGIDAGSHASHGSLTIPVTDYSGETVR